mmetsp:Transcript_73948/g.239035  ORF Transcript_73948/g.239035 Transcript_73948/m.239035 type:complete len:272 (+) Transcript_73948:870-1685(+)
MPSFVARSEDTVGGSWQWSPSSASCRQPLQMGTTVAGSVACEASSTRTLGKVYSFSIALPAPTAVQHTASARSIARCTSSRARWRAASLSSESRVTPQAFAAISSAQYCSSSGRAISGRPRRTTRTPARARPSTRLSTAMLESLVASSAAFLSRRMSPETRTHCCMILMAVEVLPVPGGPCTSATEQFVALLRASTWLEFMPSAASARRSLRSPFGGMRASSATRLLPRIVRETQKEGRLAWPNRLPRLSPASCCRRSGSARRCRAVAMRA